MTTRRFVLHLIVGLLSFLIGVTAAVALGGFDPLARFSRSYRRHYTIPPQTMSESGCRSRRRTAEYRYYEQDFSGIPPSNAVPVIPEVPFGEKDAPKPPRAPRPKH
ncbi:MAG: hypothetical protein ICV68_01245 [Pyrinomonadaceae bacterium]|nr:hypothetical protein [Pyrinomonadaceae bacterium]